MSAQHRLLWIVPETQGGIRSYSDTLWPVIQSGWKKDEFGDVVEPLYRLPSSDRLQFLRPTLVHIQHEFGVMGSKLPGRYHFPKWLAQARRALPQAKFVATAHTVLDHRYVYPWKNRGWQTLPRLLGNQLVVPFLRPLWLEKTWGPLDAVIVHSALQVETIRKTHGPRVVEIPHFVPEMQRLEKKTHEVPTVMVFGYFSPEKGQDIAIEALARMKVFAQLVLAGGLRRPEDEFFLDRCKKLIQRFKLQNRVTITGFLPKQKIGPVFESADVVLAPFRETSGSGSLAEALGRGASVLASDLPLNQEIQKRRPGALTFFCSGNPEDCARKLDALLTDGDVRQELSGGAWLYAQEHSPRQIAAKHIEFYRSLLRHKV